MQMKSYPTFVTNVHLTSDNNNLHTPLMLYISHSRPQHILENASSSINVIGHIVDNNKV